MSHEYFVVSVRLLEDEKIEEIQVPEDASGKWLFEEICRQQGVMQEREYFGLRYLEHEMLSSPTKRWINLTKNLLSQLKHTYPRQVSFRIKHYPADPINDLRLPKSHYLLYHQLRRDLISGRLVMPTDVLIRLAALVVQVELGDSSVQAPLQTFTENDGERQYLREFRVLHNQTERLESLIIKEHEKLENVLPSEAASELIHLASSLETYGIDPIRVKTKAYGSRSIHLGLTHQGVAEFISNRRQKLYPWSAISWMTCNGRDFVVATSHQHPGRKKKTITSIHYKCDNKSVAQALWEWASDRQLFFTLDKSSSVKPIKSKRTLFQRTRTFTFSGRCRREVIGRPMLTTSLPTDICALSVAEENLSLNNPTSSNAYSLSMGALTNGTGRSMNALNENNTEDGESTQTAPVTTTFGLSSSQFGHSQAPPFSEPSVICNATTSNSVSESIGNQDASHIQSNLSDTFVVSSNQLVPLFANLPKRRFSTEARKRQRELLMKQSKYGLSQHEHSDLFDTDDECDYDDTSSEAAVEALNSVAKAEEALLTNEAAQVTKKRMSSSPGKSWFSFLYSSSNTEKESKQSTSVQEETISNANHSPLLNVRNNDVRSAEANSEPSTAEPISVWRLAAVSAGFLTCASIFGLALILEAEVHSPIMATIRGNPWLLDFDSRFYRPMRSALLGFWRR
ncbi:FERM domain-containing protein isoform 1 [Schistosoma japonicum]|uniref:FERM domain-containing protein isoform 1 n=2 Tax=Schistosoma japonicum TaxID=6182 RepID=A0A4Z2DHJ0_SCHJA|nr:FERM domain-containing protein 3 [Schistosoma japonicum]TNN15943.1 FERM domain-containing protein isoform 1 [Schistosoma japonicum]